MYKEKVTAETRMKMSASQKGENNGFYVKKHSEEKNK